MDADPRTPAGQECAAAEAWLAKGSPRAALTAAGAALAQAPESRRARRLRARALERYDWSHAGRRLLEVYERVIAARGPRPPRGPAAMPPPLPKPRPIPT